MAQQWCLAYLAERLHGVMNSTAVMQSMHSSDAEHSHRHLASAHPLCAVLQRHEVERLPNMTCRKLKWAKS